MSKKLLDTKILKLIKFFSFILLIFLLFVEIRNIFIVGIYSSDGSVNFKFLITDIFNFIVIIFFFILFFFPERIEFLATSAFCYSILISTMEENNPMWICMFFLGISLLYTRGYFIYKTKFKILMSNLIIILLLITKIRFGLEIFFKEVIESLGYIFVYALTFFLFLFNKNTEENKYLNLAKFSHLTESDIILLELTLQNKQYKTIAKEVFRAEGTVRNRLNKIYDILGVYDKMGFISTYSGYKIIYQK